MPRPVHFEIIAQDTDRAQRFYEEVFGWKINKADAPMDYRLVETGKEPMGIDGAIASMEGRDRGGTINTIDVPDITAYCDKVRQAGGTVPTCRRCRREGATIPPWAARI